MSASDKADMITLPVGRSQGMTYGLPWELRVIGLPTQQAVARSRLQRPEDLTELATTTAELTKITTPPASHSAFNPSDPAGGMEWCTATVAGFGGKFINDDGTGAFDTKPWVDVATTSRSGSQVQIHPQDVVLSGMPPHSR